jgi:hypothetical protein
MLQRCNVCSRSVHNQPYKFCRRREDEEVCRWRTRGSAKGQHEFRTQQGEDTPYGTVNLQGNQSSSSDAMFVRGMFTINLVSSVCRGQGLRTEDGCRLRTRTAIEGGQQVLRKVSMSFRRNNVKILRMGHPISKATNLPYSPTQRFSETFSFVHGQPDKFRKWRTRSSTEDG